jgi:hypothetical protein
LKEDEMKSRGTILGALLLFVAPIINAQASGPDLKWHKDLRGKVDEATRLAATDPVEAAVIFKEVLSGSRKKPTPAQRAWLEEQLASLQPRAGEVLQADYDRAAKATDLRGMILAAAVAREVGYTSLRQEPTLDEVKNRMLEGAPVPELWKISEVAASFAKGYSESGSIAFSVTVPKGSQVLRVKARVENSSEGTDPAYVPSALGSLKRVLSAFSATTETHRWLDQNLMFVVADGGALISCAALGEGSDLARMKMRTGNDQLVYPPTAIKKGGSVGLDAVFVVPIDAKVLQLVVLGAAPITLSPAPPTK